MKKAWIDKQTKCVIEQMFSDYNNYRIDTRWLEESLTKNSGIFLR